MKSVFFRLLPIHWSFIGYSALTGLVAVSFSTATNVYSVNLLPRFLVFLWIISWLLLNDKLNKKAWRFINMAFPLAILGLFYYETQFLNQFLFSFRDPYLAEWEFRLFGFQPSVAFSKYYHSIWMVEIMSFAYLSYFLMIPGFCLYLFFKNSLKLESSVFLIVTSFLIFYLFFLIFPASGPQFYFYNDYQQLPEGGIIKSLLRLIQSLGEGPTAAFPSSHVAISLIILWLSFKYARPVFFIALPVSILLCFSAVYIKAHYVIDVLAAFVAVPLVFKLSDNLWQNLKNISNNWGSNSEILIRQVESREDLHEFIQLPLRLHKNHKSWTPPLLLDEWNLFDPSKNPAFMHCSTIRLIAIKKNEVVGRVMGIIHHEYNKEHNENNARFAYMEVPEDDKVFKALMQHIEAWAKDNKCTGLVGPFGFSDKEPQGFVIEGFEEPAVMFTSGNFSYLPKMTEEYGLKQFIKLVQYKFPIGKQTFKYLTPFSSRALRNGEFIVKEFTSNREIKPFVKPVFDLINQAYTSIYGFSKVTKKEADDFANRFLPLLNPRLIKFVVDKNGDLAGFVVAMPNLAEALKKSEGKLLPFGWYHLLKANRRSGELVLLLGAIRENARNRGVDAILGEYLLRSALELGHKEIDSHLIMEENYKMRREIERMEGFRLYKRYCIYFKLLSN